MNRCAFIGQTAMKPTYIITRKSKIANFTKKQRMSNSVKRITELKVNQLSLSLNIKECTKLLM
jgi:hypothetical protein